VATGTDTAQLGCPVRQAGRPIPVRAETTARPGRALYLPAIVIARTMIRQLAEPFTSTRTEQP
jgi:hypothetical protein